jgi:hypothetical protein
MFFRIPTEPGYYWANNKDKGWTGIVSVTIGWGNELVAYSPGSDEAFSLHDFNWLSGAFPEPK